MNAWRLSSRARTLIFIALLSPLVAFIVGIVFEVFRNPIALMLSPLIGISLYEARGMSWTKWEIALAAAAIAAVGLRFLISPSYIGHLP